MQKRMLKSASEKSKKKKVILQVEVNVPRAKKNYYFELAIVVLFLKQYQQKKNVFYVI